MLRLVPVLDLIEAGVFEHFDPVIDIAPEVKVRHGGLVFLWLDHSFLLSKSLLRYFARSELETVLAAAPYSKCCNTAWFEDPIRLLNRTGRIIDEHEDLVGDVAGEPGIWEG